MVRIRKHRVLKVKQIRDVLRNLEGLYADGQDLAVQFLEAWIISLQLTELRPARASATCSVE